MANDSVLLARRRAEGRSVVREKEEAFTSTLVRFTSFVERNGGSHYLQINVKF